MANPVVEIGPRCLINFCVFATDKNYRKILSILLDNDRHYTFEKPSTLSLWKITVRCNITNACVIWKLIGYLTTDSRL